MFPPSAGWPQRCVCEKLCCVHGIKLKNGGHESSTHCNLRKHCTVSLYGKDDDASSLVDLSCSFTGCFCVFCCSGPDGHRSDQTRSQKEDLNGNCQAEHPWVAAWLHSCEETPLMPSHVVIMTMILIFVITLSHRPCLSLLFCVCRGSVGPRGVVECDWIASVPEEVVWQWLWLHHYCQRHHLGGPAGDRHHQTGWDQISIKFDVDVGLSKGWSFSTFVYSWPFTQLQTSHLIIHGPVLQSV